MNPTPSYLQFNFIGKTLNIIELKPYKKLNLNKRFGTRL